MKQIGFLSVSKMPFYKDITDEMANIHFAFTLYSNIGMQEKQIQMFSYNSKAYFKTHGPESTRQAAVVTSQSLLKDSPENPHWTSHI